MGAMRHLTAGSVLLLTVCGAAYCLPRPELPHTPGYAMGNSSHYVPCQPKAHQFLLLQLGPAFDNKRMSLTRPTAASYDEGNTQQRSHRRRSGRSYNDEDLEWGPNAAAAADTHPLDYINGWYSGSPAAEQSQLGGSLRRAKRHSDSSGEELDSRVMDATAVRNSTDLLPRLRHAKNLATTAAAGRRKRNKSRKRASEMAAIFRKPLWQCKMETKWKKMKDGIFPPFIQVGQCTQQTCMYGMYKCTPKKYVIKVLKRDSQRCQPIPTLSTSTDFEEVWTFVNYKVTVCCDCSRLRGKKHRQ